MSTAIPVVKDDAPQQRISAIAYTLPLIASVDKWRAAAATRSRLRRSRGLDMTCSKERWPHGKCQVSFAPWTATRGRLRSE